MPLSRAILLLAIPMVLEMAAESLFAVADIFWAAKLGADAVTVVGMTESMLVIVYAMSIGLSMGIGALVARRTGEKDHDGAARAAVQGIDHRRRRCRSLVGVAGVLAGPALLGVMGASDAVQAIGAGYSRIMLGGCVDDRAAVPASTPPFAARGTRRSRCGRSGSRTGSTSCSGRS